MFVESWTIYRTAMFVESWIIYRTAMFVESWIYQPAMFVESWTIYPTALPDVRFSLVCCLREFAIYLSKQVEFHENLHFLLVICQ